MTQRVIVMIGPSYASRGGMASVINSWRRSGLWERWPIVFLPTHVEGSALQKLRVAALSLLRLIALLARGRVALLHAHVPRRRAFWRKAVFIAVARLARCPYVVHLHSGGFTAFYHDECAPWQRALVRDVLDGAARIIVLSDLWYQWLDGITRNTRIVRVYNFVEMPDVAAHERDTDTLVFLGRLSEEKGFFDLLHALVRVKQAVPEVQLLCGGTGDLQKVVQTLRQLQIEKHVTLLGWVDDEQRARLLQQGAVFVLPSHAEGVPMGVLEAMAAGLPVVATRVGGVPEMIDHGVEGLLVDRGDVEGLVQALRDLLLDAKLRRAMGAAARDRVLRQFTAQAALPPLEQMYAELTVRSLNANKLVNDT